jgi:hypothetical protein
MTGDDGNWNHCIGAQCVKGWGEQSDICTRSVPRRERWWHGSNRCAWGSAEERHHLPCTIRALHIVRAAGVSLPLLTGALRVSAGFRTTVKHDTQRVHQNSQSGAVMQNSWGRVACQGWGYSRAHVSVPFRRTFLTLSARQDCVIHYFSRFKLCHPLLACSRHVDKRWQPVCESFPRSILVGAVHRSWMSFVRT